MSARRAVVLKGRGRWTWEIMLFKTIVFGIDFSENSLAAARWAAHHFAPIAEFVLVHVAPQSNVLPPARRMPPTLDQLRVVEPHLQGGLRGFGELLGARRARTDSVSGDPAEVLAFSAAQVGADLICVGSGRHRRGSARFGATTPHRLIARAGVPVLVAPGAPSGAPNRILVPLDQRASSRTALQTAARLATAYEASLDALYVIETDTPRLGSPRMEGKNDTSFASTQRWAAALVDDLELVSGRAASFVHRGDPGEEIVSHARRSDAGLIVMGTGDSAFSLRDDHRARHVGSTTRFVIWAAPCPVLAIPPSARTTIERTRPARGYGFPLVQLERDEVLAEVSA